MEQIRRIMRPTDVPDQGLLCDLLWSDPDKETMGWGENDRGVSFTFGAEVVAKFLHKHDLDLICRAHQVMYLQDSRFFQKYLLPYATLLLSYQNHFQGVIITPNLSFKLEMGYILLSQGTQWLSDTVLDSTDGPRVQASPASLRCGPSAKHIYPSLVLVQPRKTLPCFTERLLMGRK